MITGRTLVNGLFYCQNISKLADRERDFWRGGQCCPPYSTPYRENGVFYGLVGFDDCGIRRFWTKEQIEGADLYRQAAVRVPTQVPDPGCLSESVLNLHSVLDQQEVWLYVLDPDTYPALPQSKDKGTGARSRTWQALL